MVQAAQYYPRLSAALCCGLRFLPAYEKMRRALSGGLVGPEVKLCDVRVNLRSLVGKRYSWLCDEGMGGGVLNLVGSHVVDLLHFLSGRRATRVHGTLRTMVEETETIRGIRRIGADDFASFQLEMEGGALAAVTLHAQMSGFQQVGTEENKFIFIRRVMFSDIFIKEVTVTGSEGHLVARNGNLYHCRRGGNEEPLYLDEEKDEISTAVDKGSQEESEGDEALLSGIYLRGLGLLFRHLAKKLQINNEDEEEVSPDRRSPSLATFEQAQYVQSVLEAVRRSSKQRSWTQVTLKTEEDLRMLQGSEEMLHALPPLSPKANLLVQKQQLQQRQRLH